MKGQCQFCGGTPPERASVCFPFGSPSQTYRPDTYEVCTPCVKESTYFTMLPRGTTVPEYGEYNFFVHYDCPPSCGNCGPDHALSIEEVETFISRAKCPMREVSVDYGHNECTYPSIEKMIRGLPRKYVPNAKWKARELDLISKEEVFLRKRRREVETLE